MVNKDDVDIIRKELEANATKVRSPGEIAFNRMMDEVMSNQHELKKLRRLKDAMNVLGKMMRGWEY